MMNRNLILSGAATLLALVAALPAGARPQYLRAFKTYYKTAESKPALNAANCGMCHMGSPRDGKFNEYGEALQTALGTPDVQEPGKIVAALQAAEKKQNAKTKVPFARMIQADLLPASDKAPGG